MRSAGEGDAAVASAVVQRPDAPLRSGTYGEFTLGVDGSHLTGYFDSGTGEDPSTGKPTFTCTFYLRGVLDHGQARVVTWLPGTPDDIIGGTLTVAGSEVRVHLDAEHGGCWNVMHFADPEPASFSLDAAGDWIALRVVAAPRAHFSGAPDAGAMGKPYAVRGDAVRVLERSPGWVRARVQRTEGWLRDADLFAEEPPAQ
jgi:hypothetical protein